MPDYQSPRYDPQLHQQRMYGNLPPDPGRSWARGPQPQYAPRQDLPPGYEGQPDAQGCYPPPQQGQPSRPPQQPAPHAQKSRHHARGVLGLAVVAVIIFAVIKLASGDGSGTTWKAHVEDYTVINPADLAVTVQVSNTGTAAATPTCTVQAQDPAYAYTGIDEGTLTSPVQPGKTVTYVDNVTITHQGAQYVTQVTVSC